MKFNIEVEMTPAEFKELTGVKNYGEIMDEMYDKAATQNPFLKITQEMTQQLFEQTTKYNKKNS